MRTIGRLLTTVLAALVAVGIWTADGRAAGQYAGTWMVRDSAGKAFKITLAEDGNATGTREEANVTETPEEGDAAVAQEEGRTGKWSEKDETAVITWESGWTTLIHETCAMYTKSAYKDGASLEGEPTFQSIAQKVD